MFCFIAINLRRTRCAHRNTITAIKHLQASPRASGTVFLVQLVRQLHNPLVHERYHATKALHRCACVHHVHYVRVSDITGSEPVTDLNKPFSSAVFMKINKQFLPYKGSVDQTLKIICNGQANLHRLQTYRNVFVNGQIVPV